MSKQKTAKPITPSDVARIHSAEAKQNNGKVSSNSFTARAQSIVSKRK